jgi:hypothetical protein
MSDTIRELKVDELENVVGGGGASSGNSNTSDWPGSSKSLKSIVWGDHHGGQSN